MTRQRVASNGNVVTCCRDLEHKGVMGNPFQQDLKSIWNRAPYMDLRRALLDARPDAAAACASCDIPYDSA